MANIIKHPSRNNTRRTTINASSTPIKGGRSITAGVRNRSSKAPIMGGMNKLSPEKQEFARVLRGNMQKQASSIMAATNTSNIAMRPDFLELLPLFVQKLYILDVFGSVAMRSRQQLIPYFKFKAENTKGETKANTILSDPFVHMQGNDPNFTGRIVKNEILAEGGIPDTSLYLAYTPILNGSVTIEADNKKMFYDNGDGTLVDSKTRALLGKVNYSTGEVTIDDKTGMNALKATYQYDNENVGPDPYGNYGAAMGKGYLELDEINLVAEAHQIASYWSIYSAFAAQQEYQGDIESIAKEAAFSEITAEINSSGFKALYDAAARHPEYNWDAGPVSSGAVVPSDYLNMFKLKLQQASAAIYQMTRLSQPNRLIVGSNTAAYISMINSFVAENAEDTVGPYKLGKLDHFDIYVDPSYDPNSWVMACKSNDIRRNSGLFGEYMPLTQTNPITLADMSVQNGYASMYAIAVVNPESVVRGSIVGTV